MREESGKEDRYLQQIDEIILAGQNHGQMGFGVTFELAKRMEFGKHLESEQASLIDDEQRLDFLVDELTDSMANDTGENGARRASAFCTQSGGQLAVGFQNRAAGGGDPQGMELRGMKPARGKAQRGGFTGADCTG